MNLTLTFSSTHTFQTNSLGKLNGKCRSEVPSSSGRAPERSPGLFPSRAPLRRPWAKYMLMLADSIAANDCFLNLSLPRRPDRRSATSRRLSCVLISLAAYEPDTWWLPGYTKCDEEKIWEELDDVFREWGVVLWCSTDSKATCTLVPAPV
ncbi:uncharacterized protein BT62DRAFT_78752 [Guyanagaster necrorhizus]|uniref:Uncharacterized protein n=1 Tax=Guyanagaster necrorhizus TaxID=856835 RepID=A0A9P8ATU2_9AGAR|nr:uncharacterized protein BT62DRAFT_78752 [Guyanagaster necrorhizus MCA 3950]KAG7447366.1 hypothetical protein BT62DRAFT_78752 [Guyanagaster necrorhizus MCA 3950]